MIIIITQCHSLICTNKNIEHCQQPHPPCLLVAREMPHCLGNSDEASHPGLRYRCQAPVHWLQPRQQESRCGGRARLPASLVQSSLIYTRMHARCFPFSEHTAPFAHAPHHVIPRTGTCESENEADCLCCSLALNWGTWA